MMNILHLPPAVRLQLWAASREHRALLGTPRQYHRYASRARHLRHSRHPRIHQARTFATVHTEDGGKAPGGRYDGGLPKGTQLDLETRLKESQHWSEFWATARQDVVSRQDLPPADRETLLRTIDTCKSLLKDNSQGSKDQIQTLSNTVGEQGLVRALMGFVQQLISRLKGPQSQQASVAGKSEDSNVQNSRPTINQQLHQDSNDQAPAHIDWLTRENYPHASGTLIKSKRALGAEDFEAIMFQTCKKRRIPFKAEKSSSEAPGKGWRCSLALTIGDSQVKVVGLRPNKAGSKLDAWYKALTAMHTNGALSDVLSSPETERANTEQEKSRPAKVAAALAEHYPDLPPRLFSSDLMGKVLYNQMRKPGIKATVTIGYDNKNNCTLQINLPSMFEGKFLGLADGKKPRQRAERRAWAQALIQLHEQNALRHLFPEGQDMKLEDVDKSVMQKEKDVVLKLKDVDKSVMQKEKDVVMELEDVDESVMQKEKDVVFDIWNYAARHGLTPKFEIKTIRQRSAQRVSKGQRGKQAKQAKLEKVVKVAVSLPEHDIHVTKYAKQAVAAEIAAGLAFKRAAEKRQKAGQELASSAHQGFVALSTETASDFIKFFRMRNQGISIDVEYGTVAAVRDTFHRATVTVNGAHVGTTAIFKTKKGAEMVAYLSASVHLALEQPNLLDEFAAMARSGALKGFDRGTSPIEVPIGRMALNVMQDAIYQARRAGLPDVREALVAENSTRHTRASRRALSAWQRDEASQRHLREKRDYDNDPGLEMLRTARAGLPMCQYNASVLDLVSNNLYSIVIGATGSGKTTQVPQILLDDAIENGKGGWCDIICTQPRRLAATSVAQRVATERNARLGDTVGYQVRGDSRQPRAGGSITFCTTGLLLEQMKHGVDDIMDNVSHLIIDEVHERDIFIDFLLITLKKAVIRRQAEGKKIPKVILMSATIDEKLFSNYLPNNVDGKLVPCPSLSVPGRTFPVQETYLDEILGAMERAFPGDLHRLARLRDDRDATMDYLDAEQAFAGAAGPAPVIDWKRRTDRLDPETESAAAQKEEALVPIALVTSCIAHICNTADTEGAILAFLPGLDEITKTEEMLLKHMPCRTDFADPEKFRILKLHSTVPPEQQKLILEPVPPGVRKIILSTNIAETSVTVPDVKHVVDLGKSRESRYDQVKRITELQTVWASNSNVRQRAGRAGRVSNGNYYALYTRERKQTLSASGLPELLRSDLQEIALSVKARGFVEPVADFLAEAIEPPTASAVTTAVDNLKGIEAFTDNENLTALGNILSRLPIHPSLGKMVLLGILFRCLDPVITLGAMDAERCLFSNPPELRSEANRKRAVFHEGESDHLAYLNAYEDIRTHVHESGQFKASTYARSMFLHFGAYRSTEQLAGLIERALVDAQLIARSSPSEANNYRLGGDALNENSDNAELVKSLVVAGLHPNIGYQSSGPKSRFFRTPTEGRAMMHPRSTNYAVKSRVAVADEDKLYTYNQLARSVSGDMLYIRDTTRITPLMAILFGGRLEREGTTSLTMDKWLSLRFRAYRGDSSTRITLEFRKLKDRILNEAFRSLLDPTKRLRDNDLQDAFVQNLVELLDIQASAGQDFRPPSWENRNEDYQSKGQRGEDQRGERPMSNLGFGRGNGGGTLRTSFLPARP